MNKELAGRVNQARATKLAFERMLKSYPYNNAKSKASFKEIDLADPNKDVLELEDEYEYLCDEVATLYERVTALDGVLLIDRKTGNDGVTVRVLTEEHLKTLDCPGIFERVVDELGYKNSYSHDEFCKILKLAEDYIHDAFIEIDDKPIDFMIEEEER